MKILVLPSRYPTDYDRIRGSFYREQALAMSNCGIEVRVLSVVGYSIKEILRYRRFLKKRYDYIDNKMPTIVRTVLNIPKMRKLNFVLRAFLGMQEFDNLYQAWKPELIHAHCFQGGDIARRIKEKYGIPYTITEHSTSFFGNPNHVDRDISKIVFQEAEGRWAVSPALATRLSELNGLDFKVLPNSVDINSFRPVNSTINSDNEFVFMVVGYLIPRKRVYELIRSFYKAKDFCSRKIHLKIVGDGPERKRLESYVDSLGENDSISFLGIVPREDVAMVITDADCLVVPSLTETFGVTVIEALSCGVPVISTRCGGPEHILAEAPFCSLVENVDESLTFKMVEFAERGSVDREAIRTFAVERYSAEAVARRYIEELSSIITQPK